MERNIFTLHAPVVSDFAYLLLVYLNKGGSPFGSSRPTVLGIQRFAAEATPGGMAYRGYDSDGALAVEFNTGTPYILVRANRVDALTPVEAALKDREDEE